MRIDNCVVQFSRQMLERQYFIGAHFLETVRQLWYRGMLLIRINPGLFIVFMFCEQYYGVGHITQ